LNKEGWGDTEAEKAGREERMYEKRKEMIYDAELSPRPLTTFTRSFKNTHKYSPNSRNACFNAKRKEKASCER